MEQAEIEMEGEPKRREYDQIDFVLTARRWKNQVSNCETDPDCWFSDHRPIIATFTYKLKYIPRG